MVGIKMLKGLLSSREVLINGKTIAESLKRVAPISYE
jgi:hypothetical protein